MQVKNNSSVLANYRHAVKLATDTTDMCGEHYSNVNNNNNTARLLALLLS